MSQQGRSTPKMRRAFTPRVKSSLNIHNTEPKKALHFTEKKYQPYQSNNPQRFEDPIAKKLNLNFSPQKVGKFDVALLHTDTDSPIKKNNYFSNAPRNKPSEIVPLKGKQFGRNLQWPANDNMAYKLDHGDDNKEGKLSRCMSAHTIKSNYTTRSERTDKIKESRKQFNEKFSVAFDYLLQSNTDYLKQKINMCNQKARPKQQIFTLKRPSITTTNKDFYKKNQDKHRLDIQPQNQKMSLLMSELKVCGNSTTQEFHQGKDGKRSDLAQWTEGFKLQGPICQVTTNSNAFPNHGEYEKMVPIAVWNEHPLGMKHRQSSTNSRLLKGEFTHRAELATWNNLNPVANDLFNPKKGTIYGKQFANKERQPIQQWPMPEHKLIVTDGKFSTQMKSSMVNFNKHEINHDNQCNCGRKKH